MAFAGGVAKAFAYCYGCKGVLVRDFVEMINVHQGPGAEHRIAAAYGQPAFVAEKLLDCYVVVAFVLYIICIYCIFQDTVPSENLVAEAEFSVFHQFHYSGCCYELADGCHAHDCSGPHGLFFFFVCPAEALGVQEGVVPHYGKFHPPYLPSLHECPHILFHPCEIFTIGHFICKYCVDAVYGSIAAVSFLARTNGRQQQ